jgi:hypothetical protein
MNDIGAGSVGGFIAGGLMSLAMLGGRRTGLLAKTLGEFSEDWLDRTFKTRHLVGESGTFAAEQFNHFAASAAFGAGFAAVGGHRAMNPLAGGLLYGSALYLLNIVGIAPLLGITSGEWNEPAPVVAQRLGMHLLFGVTLTYVMKALTTKRG